MAVKKKLGCGLKFCLGNTASYSLLKALEFIYIIQGGGDRFSVHCVTTITKAVDLM